MKQHLKEHVLALVLFMILTLIMSWPVVMHLSNQVAGIGGDPWQTLWRFEEKSQLSFSEAIKEFTGRQEAQLVNLSVWPWMPLYKIIGNPATYNIVWLLSFILSGYAIFILTQYLSREFHRDSKESTPLLFAASFLAGVMYMFLPFHVAHGNGHFGAMQIQWLPFAITAFLWLVKKPTFGKTMLLALLVTMQAWTEHHYALFFLIFILVHIIAFRKQYKDLFKEKKNVFLAILLAVILGFTVLLPYYPTVRLASSDASRLDLGFEQTIRFSANLFSFVIPSSYHSVWGNLLKPLYIKSFTGNESEATQFLGILPLLLILFFHQFIPHVQKKFWITVATVFFFIAIGPRLHIFSYLLPIPMPYSLLDSLPVFSSMRAVGRAGVMIGLAVSMLFFWTLASQIKRKQNVPIILAVLLAEFLFLPTPMQSTALSPVYSEIAKIPGKTLVEIPAGTNYVSASRTLYASSVHHKDVIGSIALERGDDGSTALLARSLPALRQLMYLKTKELREGREDFFGQNLVETLPDVMRYLDSNTILVNTDSISEYQASAIKKFLEQGSELSPQRFGDATLYVMPDKEKQFIKSDDIFVMRNAGFDSVVFDEEKNRTTAIIQKDAIATIVNTAPVNHFVRLRFSFSDDTKSGFTLSYDGKAIATVNPGESSYDMIFSVEPGEHRLVFTNNSNGFLQLVNPIISVTTENK